MLRSRLKSLALVRPDFKSNGLMLGTPLVPMMLLTTMIDCCPVMALVPP